MKLWVFLQEVEPGEREYVARTVLERIYVALIPGLEAATACAEH